MANADKITKIYNGRYTVKFLNDSHHYYVDGKRQTSVTTILGKILAKPQLMYWPLNEAIKYLEDKLPNIDAADLELAKKAHAKKRDSGADTGTLIHELVEKDLLGEALTLDEISKLPSEVALAMGAYAAWKEKTKPEVLGVEQVLYSRYGQYAGTYDSILKIDGVTYLVDLKTTNASRYAPLGVYPEHFIQLGGYLYAYEEQRVFEIEYGGTSLPVIDEVMVLSVKKDGKVDTVTSTQVGLDTVDCENLWEAVLDLYKGLEELKTKLGGKSV